MPHSQDIHYGKKFAQTQELLAARAMNHELEELAGLPPAQPETKSALPPVPAHRGPPLPPIGALPSVEELPDGLAFGHLYELALRQAQTAQSAAIDLARAGWHLVGLPFEAVKLLARRVRYAVT